MKNIGIACVIILRPALQDSFPSEFTAERISQNHPPPEYFMGMVFLRQGTLREKQKKKNQNPFHVVRSEAQDIIVYPFNRLKIVFFLLVRHRYNNNAFC